MDLISISQEQDLKFKTELRQHEFYSDMSEKDGGKDRAPAPAEYLVSALGNCIGMTAELYCAAHGYDSGDIEISTTYVLNDHPKRLKNITIDVTLSETFPENRKKAVLNAVKTCVIYNSLHPDIEVDIEIE